jgi:hypothetical protein
MDEHSRPNPARPTYQPSPRPQRPRQEDCARRAGIPGRTSVKDVGNGAVGWNAWGCMNGMGGVGSGDEVSETSAASRAASSLESPISTHILIKLSLDRRCDSIRESVPGVHPI